MDTTQLKTQKVAYPVAFLGLILILFSPLRGGESTIRSGKQIRTEPLGATIEIAIDPKPLPGGYSLVTLTIKPTADTHLRLIAWCEGNEIIGGKLYHDEGRPWNYITRKVLFQDWSFRKGVTRTTRFQLHYVNPNDFYIFFEPWENKDGTGWHWRERDGFKQWLFFDVGGGEFATPEEAQARGLRKTIKDTLEWEVTRYLSYAIDRLSVLFYRDEPHISRPEALCLVDKAYYMAEWSRENKDGVYYNLNQYEEPDIRYRRAIKAIQEDVAKQVNAQRKSKLDVYRELVKNWTEERARLKRDDLYFPPSLRSKPRGAQ
jgi:hypothetical protein